MSVLLYTKLKACLEKDLEAAFMGSEVMYMNNGLEFLQAIQEEYQPAYSKLKKAEEIAALTNPAMKTGESIVKFANRLKEMEQRLKANGHCHDQNQLRMLFLNKLGQSFEAIHTRLNEYPLLPDNMKQFNTLDL